MLLQIAINKRERIQHVHILRLLPKRLLQNVPRAVVMPRMRSHRAKLIEQIEVRRIGCERVRQKCLGLFETVPGLHKLQTQVRDSTDRHSAWR